MSSQIFRLLGTDTWIIYRVSLLMYLSVENFGLQRWFQKYNKTGVHIPGNSAAFTGGKNDGKNYLWEESLMISFFNRREKA